jgi:nucleotidyltransferase/DNA polymerase involved in DNA repair
LAEKLAGVQSEMLMRTGSRVRIAAARTVTVAKTASRLDPRDVPGGDSNRRGVCVVAPGEERSFLAPLPLGRLHGLSMPTLAVLRAGGLVTIGELQRVPKAVLQAEFGKAEGLDVWRRARGLDGRGERREAARTLRTSRAAQVAKSVAAPSPFPSRRSRRLGPMLGAWGSLAGELLRRLAF